VIVCERACHNRHVCAEEEKQGGGGGRVEGFIKSRTHPMPIVNQGVTFPAEEVDHIY